MYEKFKKRHKTFCLMTYIFYGFLSLSMTMDFKSEQKKYERVREAYKAKESTVSGWLKTHNLTFATSKIFLRAFKAEEKLEVWASSKTEEKFVLIHTFDFCVSSGTLGPKRNQGDLQTPEGIYHIDRFNPVSNFHLSLGLNYPNSADKILGTSTPGGDIFIHGNCVSVGCIPITDDKIKELYLLCVEAKNAGQSKIYTHIYPFKMTNENFEKYSAKYPQHKALWQELKPVYEHFESKKQIPVVTISSKGKYVKN
jgi:murein L,D-transpeptidase YafK